MAVSWLSLTLALVGLAKTLVQVFLGRSEIENRKAGQDVDAKARSHDLLLKVLKARRKARKAFLHGNQDTFNHGDQLDGLPKLETPKE